MTEEILNYFQNKKWYRDRIEHIEEIPPRRARYSQEKVKLPKPLEDYLEKHEIRLYTHQYKTLKEVREGNNVIITTPTASGKTLSFTLPVIEDLTNNPTDTALYIYPTKALANDQLKSLLDIDKECDLGIYPEKYDGDTPKSKRPEIKRKSRLIITNPYELHYILPWHSQWKRFFRKHQIHNNRRSSPVPRSIRFKHGLFDKTLEKNLQILWFRTPIYYINSYPCKP